MNQMTNNVLRVKKVNKDIVRQVIKGHAGITKKEVAEETGLSVATCGSILNEFVVSNEVFEGELQSSNGGRAARVYYYNENYSLAAIMGILVDGDVVTYNYSIINSFGQISENFSRSLTKITPSDIIETTGELLGLFNNLKSIAISVPGIVQNGKILDCDEKHLAGVDLKKEIESRYALRVIVEAEPRVKIYGYYKIEKKDGSSLAIITAARNQCLGSSFISDGHLIKGINGMAGEIQYLMPTCGDDGQDEKYYYENLVYAVRAIISIINPAEIVLTGGMLSSGIEKSIYEQCSLSIPEAFIPKIIYLADSHVYLQKGLIEMALENMEAEIKLIKK